MIGLLFLNIFTFVAISPLVNVEAASSEVEDGTYSMDYVILRAEDESVSIANDYFDKPATLIVEDGEEYIQFSINHSEWTKELEAPLDDTFVHVDVIEEYEAEDTRLVQFKVDRNLSDPLEFKMHVLIEEMEPVYDNRYTVRFDFDLDSLEEIAAKEIFVSEESDQEEAATGGNEEDQNDDKSNSTISITFAIVLVVFTILIAIVLWRTFKKRKK